MFIFYFVCNTKHQVWLICNENKLLLPIWCYNSSVIGLFPLGNKYFGAFVLNGLKSTGRDRSWTGDYAACGFHGSIHKIGELYSCHNYIRPYFSGVLWPDPAPIYFKRHFLTLFVKLWFSVVWSGTHVACKD